MLEDQGRATRMKHVDGVPELGLPSQRFPDMPGIPDPMKYVGAGVMYPERVAVE